MLLNLNLFLPLVLHRALLTAFEIIDSFENLMKAIYTVAKNNNTAVVHINTEVCACTH